MYTVFCATYASRCRSLMFSNSVTDKMARRVFALWKKILESLLYQLVILMTIIIIKTSQVLFSFTLLRPVVLERAEYSKLTRVLAEFFISSKLKHSKVFKCLRVKHQDFSKHFRIITAINSLLLRIFSVASIPRI